MAITPLKETSTVFTESDKLLKMEFLPSPAVTTDYNMNLAQEIFYRAFISVAKEQIGALRVRGCVASKNASDLDITAGRIVYGGIIMELAAASFTYAASDNSSVLLKVITTKQDIDNNSTDTAVTIPGQSGQFEGTNQYTAAASYIYKTEVPGSFVAGTGVFTRTAGTWTSTNSEQGKWVLLFDTAVTQYLGKVIGVFEIASNTTTTLTITAPASGLPPTNGVSPVAVVLDAKSNSDDLYVWFARSLGSDNLVENLLPSTSGGVSYQTSAGISGLGYGWYNPTYYNVQDENSKSVGHPLMTHHLRGIDNAITALYGVNTKPTDVIFVGKGGSDSAITSGFGTRGSAENPYLTVQAAINAASGEVAIVIFQGVYSESISITTSLKAHLFAVGGDVTILNNSSSTAALTITGTTQRFTSKGVTFHNQDTSSTSRAIYIHSITATQAEYSFFECVPKVGSSDGIVMEIDHSSASNPLNIALDNGPRIGAGSVIQGDLKITGTTGQTNCYFRNFDIDDEITISGSGGVYFFYNIYNLAGSFTANANATSSLKIYDSILGNLNTKTGNSSVQTYGGHLAGLDAESGSSVALFGTSVAAFTDTSGLSDENSGHLVAHNISIAKVLVVDSNAGGFELRHNGNLLRISYYIGKTGTGSGNTVVDIKDDGVSLLSSTLSIPTSAADGTTGAFSMTTPGGSVGGLSILSVDITGVPSGADSENLFIAFHFAAQRVR